MATARITITAVDALAPAATARFLYDDRVRGFGVRVTPAGAKSYFYQYRMGGREAYARRYTIGKHGSPWTPDLARERAKELAASVERGIDPADADRDRRRRAVDLAFSAYVPLFAEGYLKARWKRWEKTQAMLERDAVAVFRAKPICDIKRSDLTALWDRLADRPASARLMHATLRKMFRWAVGRGDIERSPMEGTEAPIAVAARDRTLSDEELQLVWDAAGTLGDPFAGFYRLLILTGQRREEVAGLRWEELSNAEGLWTLPADRAKNGEKHLIPLSDQARSIIDGIAGGDKWRRKGLLFSTTGKTPISGFAKAKVRLDAAILSAATKLAAEAGEPVHAMLSWRIHDIRRTVATGLQRLGIRFEVTEAVLNHVSGARSGIAGVYQRHDWRDEKRAALSAWGGHVADLGTVTLTTNVVKLAKASKQ